ncbi:MAG: hypothetical protein ABIK08_11375 [Pseudomonadota bacterium]
MQKNDSTRKPTKTPAADPAQAPSSAVKRLSKTVETDKSGQFNPAKTALAPAYGRVEDMIFNRVNGVEITYEGSKAFFRDTDIGRVIGLSRPRTIRERIKPMIESGDIRTDQVIVVMEDGITTYYLDSAAAFRLAFRSNVGDAEVIAMRMMRVAALSKWEPESDPISIEKALAAIARTLGQIEKAKNAAVISGLVSVLERYCRMAGVPMPERSLLLAAEQPRLPGV